MRGNRLLEGTFKHRFEIEYDIAKYKLMSLRLIMMQLLLSVLFKCKLYYLFNYYFKIFKLFLDSYLSTHLFYNLYNGQFRHTQKWNSDTNTYPA